MPNKKIADLIANALRDGSLVHPGRDDGPPTPVMLPMFRTTGMPPEMAELATGTATLLAEAIVALIEADHEIIEAQQAIEFRVADAAAPNRQVAVHCHCDTRRADPLAILTITNSPYVIVDGKAVIEGLTGRSVECPHRRNP